MMVPFLYDVIVVVWGFLGGVWGSGGAVGRWKEWVESMYYLLNTECNTGCHLSSIAFDICHMQWLKFRNHKYFSINFVSNQFEVQTTGMEKPAWSASDFSNAKDDQWPTLGQGVLTTPSVYCTSDWNIRLILLVSATIAQISA